MRDQVNREDITRPECGQASIYSPSVSNQHLLTLRVLLGEKCWRASNPDWVNERSLPGWKMHGNHPHQFQCQDMCCHMYMWHTHTKHQNHLVTRSRSTSPFIVWLGRTNFISRLCWESERAIIHASPAGPGKSGATARHWRERQLLHCPSLLLIPSSPEDRDRLMCNLSLEEDFSFSGRSLKDMFWG